MQYWLTCRKTDWHVLKRSGLARSTFILFTLGYLVQGDILNLVGCCLTGDQLATQTYTAVYFIFADCCIISQVHSGCACVIQGVGLVGTRGFWFTATLVARKESFCNHRGNRPGGGSGTPPCPITGFTLPDLQKP